MRWRLRCRSGRCGRAVSVSCTLRSGGGDWPVLLGVRLLRANRTVDAVVLLPGCIVACTLREGRVHRDHEGAEDAALDLHDFHAGSRAHPVVPLLVTADAPDRPAARPLLFPGVTSVIAANARSAGTWLHELAAAAGPSLDAQAWQDAPYRPVPGLIEAARSLYARHGVDALADAGADPASLRAARAAVTAAGGPR